MYYSCYIRVQTNATFLAKHKIVDLLRIPLFDPIRFYDFTLRGGELVGDNIPWWRDD